MDADLLFLCETTDDLIQFINEEVLYEKSHRLIKHCYRIGYDINTGERAAVQFELDTLKITGAGDINILDSPKNPDTNNRTTTNIDLIRKTIRKTGHIDFITGPLKVVSIFNKGGRKINSIEIIGLFNIPVIERITSSVQKMLRVEVKDRFEKYKLTNPDDYKVRSYDDLLDKIVKDILPGFNEDSELSSTEFFKKGLVKTIKQDRSFFTQYIESYHISKNDNDLQGGKKYKTTKLFWDSKAFRNFQLTPRVRGFLTKPLGYDTGNFFGPSAKFQSNYSNLQGVKRGQMTVLNNKIENYNSYFDKITKILEKYKKSEHISSLIKEPIDTIESNIRFFKNTKPEELQSLFKPLKDANNTWLVQIGKILKDNNIKLESTETIDNVIDLMAFLEYIEFNVSENDTLFVEGYETEDKNVLNLKHEELPGYIRKQLPKILTMIKDEMVKLSNDDKYKLIKNNKAFGLDSRINTIGNMEHNDVPIGVITKVSDKKYTAMIQATGHVTNSMKDDKDKLFHKFMLNVYNNLKPDIKDQFKMDLNNDDFKKHNYEGFDIYPTSDVAKRIWDEHNKPDNLISEIANDTTIEDLRNDLTLIEYNNNNGLVLYNEGKLLNDIVAAGKKYGSMIKSGAMYVLEFIMKAIRYLGDSLNRLCSVMRYERIEKKIAEAKKGTVIVVEDIPGDVYEGMFESFYMEESDSDIIKIDDKSISKVKSFFKEVISHKRIIISTICRFIPVLNPLQIIREIGKLITVIIPIGIDLIATMKEIALLQKKYAGKVKKIQMVDESSRYVVDMPSETYIMIDKFRNLANRLVDLLINSNAKSRTLEITTTDDLINFGILASRDLDKYIDQEDRRINQDRRNKLSDFAAKQMLVIEEIHKLSREAENIYNNRIIEIDNSSMSEEDKRKAFNDNTLKLKNKLKYAEKMRVHKFSQIRKMEELNPPKNISITKGVLWFLRYICVSMEKLIKISNNESGVEYVLNGKPLAEALSLPARMLVNTTMKVGEDINILDDTAELSLDTAIKMTKLDTFKAYAKSIVKTAVTVDRMMTNPDKFLTPNNGKFNSVKRTKEKTITIKGDKEKHEPSVAMYHIKNPDEFRTRCMNYLNTLRNGFKNKKKIPETDVWLSRKSYDDKITVVRSQFQKFLDIVLECQEEWKTVHNDFLHEKENSKKSYMIPYFDEYSAEIKFIGDTLKKMISELNDANRVKSKNETQVTESANYLTEGTNIINELDYLFEELEEFEEKSHRLLNTSYRIAVNVENGHFIKIIYGLNPSNVKQLGDHSLQFNKDENELLEDQKIIKNIKKRGHTDFSSQEIVRAIIDIDTKQELQIVRAVGSVGMDGIKFLAPGGGYAFDGRIDRFNAMSVGDREKVAKDPKLLVSMRNGSPVNKNDPEIPTYEVGKLEPLPTYKSTKLARTIAELLSNQYRNYTDLKSGRGIKDFKVIPTDIEQVKRKFQPIFNDIGDKMMDRQMKRYKEKMMKENTGINESVRNHKELYFNDFPESLQNVIKSLRQKGIDAVNKEIPKDNKYYSYFIETLNDYNDIWLAIYPPSSTDQDGNPLFRENDYYLLFLEFGRYVNEDEDEDLYYNCLDKILKAITNSLLNNPDFKIKDEGDYYGTHYEFEISNRILTEIWKDLTEGDTYNKNANEKIKIYEAYVASVTNYWKKYYEKYDPKYVPPYLDRIFQPYDGKLINKIPEELRLFYSKFNPIVPASIGKGPMIFPIKDCFKLNIPVTTFNNKPKDTFIFAIMNGKSGHYNYYVDEWDSRIYEMHQDADYSTGRRTTTTNVVANSFEDFLTKIMNNDYKIKESADPNEMIVDSIYTESDDTDDKKAKKILQAATRSLMVDLEKNKNITQYTANIFANLITKNLLSSWTDNFSKLTITLDSYQSFPTLEFIVPKMDQEFVSRFVKGKETISRFINRQPEIKIKMSPRIFHTIKNEDDPYHFFKRAVKYYDTKLDKVGNKFMTDVLHLNNNMKQLITHTKLSGLVTYPLSMLFIFDDVNMANRESFSIKTGDIKAVSKFLKDIITRYAAPEKEKAKILEDLKNMLKEMRDTTINNESAVYIYHLIEGVETFYADGYKDISERIEQEFIAENIDSTPSNKDAEYMKEAWGVKKLKKIPADLIPYIIIEIESIHDSNDKMIIVSYICGKLELVDWYIQLLEVGSKKYIVPHTKPQLQRIKIQLMDCYKKAMDVKIVNPNISTSKNTNYPPGYEG